MMLEQAKISLTQVHAGPLFGDWPFKGLVQNSFDFIMADCPWSFDNYSAKGEAKNAKARYECMPLADIQRLPVMDLAKPDCALWMWATNPMLPQAIETLRSWGFTFVTSGTWGKTTRHGKIAFGTGYALRCASEPFLIGKRGSPVFTKSTRSFFHGMIRKHSQKPEEAYAIAEKMLNRKVHKEPQFLELFSRTNRKGWTVFGDEIGKFGDAL